MKQTKNHLWNISADTAGRTNYDFFVTDNDEYAICFSDIDEYGMMKFVSPVQIWANQSNPALVFHHPGIRFEYQQDESCYYLKQSGIVVLLTPCSRGAHFNLLYVLFD